MIYTHDDLITIIITGFSTASTNISLSNKVSFPHLDWLPFSLHILSTFLSLHITSFLAHIQLNGSLSFFYLNIFDLSSGHIGVDNGFEGTAGITESEQ
jgi:hypothetical protein